MKQEMNSDYTLLPTNAPTLYSATMRHDANPIRTALKMFVYLIKFLIVLTWY
jgi:hypothetical protein